MPAGFLEHLQDVATSGYALVGYLAVAAAWAVVAVIKRRPESKSDQILKLFSNDKDRLAALMQITGKPMTHALTKDGIREHLRLHYKSKLHLLVFIGFLATLATLIALVGLANKARIDEITRIVSRITAVPDADAWPSKSMELLKQLEGRNLSDDQQRILVAEARRGENEIKDVLDTDGMIDEPALRDLVTVNRKIRDVVGYDTPTWSATRDLINLRVPGFLKANGF